MNDTITVTAGVVSIAGRPLLRFQNSTQAACWLMLHNYLLSAADPLVFLRPLHVSTRN